MFDGAKSASLGFFQLMLPETVSTIKNVAATETAPYANFGEAKPRTHELPRVKAKAQLPQRVIHRTAERHQLRFNSRKIWQRSHAVQHFFQQTPRNGCLVKLRRNVKPADQPLRFLHHIKRVSGRAAVLVRDAAGKRM